MRHKLTLVGSVVLAIAVLPVSSVTGYAQHDDHGTDHHSGSSGHSGGKKGPKYMGGQKGESHSHEGHTGGPHRGGPTRGGSKHTEDKIFHGHEDHEDGDPTAFNEDL
ncbi:MAG: hypothetical protein JSU95_15125 [Betaproteobacteria bacterium]|nr:MAG: hypothetical protein JSU95_15125 [Betaproteobacteria bacterium]